MGDFHIVDWNLERLDIGRKVHSKLTKKINITNNKSIVTLVLNAMRIKVAEKFRANTK